MLVLAPIEQVEVVATRSLPAQYSLIVTSGLPSGCARFAGTTVDVGADTVVVKVYNSMPTGPVACTMIYGYTTHSVSIGPLTSGVTYKVQVNDRTLDLRAQ
jgi:hypothetical protein